MQKSFLDKFKRYTPSQTDDTFLSLVLSECLRLGIPPEEEDSVLQVSSFLAAPLPFGWLRGATDEGGLQFFVDTTTGLAQWQRPGEGELVGRLLARGLLPLPGSVLWNVLAITRSSGKRMNRIDLGWKLRPTDTTIDQKSLENFAEYFSLYSGHIPDFAFMIKIAILAPTQSNEERHISRHNLDGFFRQVFLSAEPPRWPTTPIIQFGARGAFDYSRKEFTTPHKRSRLSKIIVCLLEALSDEGSLTTSLNAVYNADTALLIRESSRLIDLCQERLNVHHGVHVVLPDKLFLNEGNWDRVRVDAETKLLVCLNAIESHVPVFARPCEIDGENVGFRDLSLALDFLPPESHLFDSTGLQHLNDRELRSLCVFMARLVDAASKKLVEELALKDELSLRVSSTIAVIRRLMALN